MRSDFLNSILIPVQCDPIRPPRACLLTLLVAHITGTFYQTKLSVHSLWLLFQVDVYILLYVNDIYRCSEQLSFILFADDTNIFYQHKDINVLNLKKSTCGYKQISSHQERIKGAEKASPYTPYSIGNSSRVIFKTIDHKGD